MIFRESKIRNLLSKKFGNTINWIEPNLGSTKGLPDCFFFYRENTFFLELKRFENFHFTRDQKIWHSLNKNISNNIGILSYNDENKNIYILNSKSINDFGITRIDKISSEKFISLNINKLSFEIISSFLLEV